MSINRIYHNGEGKKFELHKERCFYFLHFQNSSKMDPYKTNFYVFKLQKGHIFKTVLKNDYGDTEYNTLQRRKWHLNVL